MKSLCHGFPPAQPALTGQKCDDATGIAELHVLADRALYAAKKAGKGFGTRYQPSLAA